MENDNQQVIPASEPGIQQNAQPTFVPPTSSPDMIFQAPAPKESKRWMWTLVIIIIVFIGAGSVGAAMKYGIGFSHPSPRTVFEKTFNAIPDIKSFVFQAQYNGKATLDAQGQSSGGTAVFNVKIDSKVDMHDKNSPQLDLTIAGSMQAQVDGNNGNASGKVHILSINKKGYLNIEDLTLTYSLSKSDPMADSFAKSFQDVVPHIKNKWISFDSPTQARKPAMNETDLQELRKKILSFDYVDKIDVLADEKIQGIDTYHYSIIIDQDKLYDDVKEIEKTLSAVLSSDYLAAINGGKNNNVSLKTGQKLHLEIWIGKNDYFVYKVKVPESTFKDATSGSMITTTGEMTMSDYNKPITVLAPKDATTMETIINSIFGSMMTSSTPPSKQLKKAR
jgi:hypothetical protein